MSAEVDIYEEEHSKALKSLKECKQRESDSCMLCKDFFKCQTRAEYINKTYQSMAKGRTGGFDFN